MSAGTTSLPQTPAPASETPAPPARGVPFPPEEVHALHADDRQAAAAVVGIMVAIFSLGLIGYICIALWAA